MHKTEEFKNDNYQKVYPAGDAVAQIDFLEDIHEIESKTHWVRGKIYGTQIKFIDEGPITAPSYLSRHKIYGNDLDSLMSTMTDGTALGYEAGSRFMYSWTPEGKERMYYLLSEKAYNSLVGLVGSECPAYRRKTRPEQAESLNFDLGTLPEKKQIIAQVSELTKKINNIHADWYNVFRKDKMLYGITDKFDEQYSGYQFLGGTYSHSGISAKWAFPDQAEDILKLYETTVSKKAPVVSFEDAMPVVSFYTSDSGESTATLCAYLEKENCYKMKIGNIIKIYHKGETTEQTVIDAAGDLFAKFKDLVSAMAELVKKNIENPIVCMINAGLGVCNLNKSHLLKAIEEYKDMYGDDAEATANDVFYVLQRALYNMRLSDKISDTKCEDCEEAMLKMLSPSFSWETHDTSIISVNVKMEE